MEKGKLVKNRDKHMFEVGIFFVVDFFWEPAAAKNTKSKGKAMEWRDMKMLKNAEKHEKLTKRKRLRKMKNIEK